jgi:UDP-N-acetylglucosamine--N-acetylmuramyl-(pentapeptide) pyrophosphoryl-undecaprenol N-acetylglucosamine transferase
MEEGGAAIVIRDEDLTPERLRAEIDTLLADRERLAAMSAASRELARPDAAAVIAAEVEAAVR